MMKLRLDYIFYHALGLINSVEIYYQPLHMAIFESFTWFAYLGINVCLSKVNTNVCIVT